ncbi:HAD-IA family hydrolase [Pseudogemmobacter humi]|uniref:phosphoglycolate phosphatase n=1 Tax=Pseudogemmobacter humi TaxID=2483812 RepID=A0A3P5XAS7_9RHOB|nr:HAD-IA family hydrolase [Pseudogemmobacter humi]VDC31718.1 Phosphoglycolate phosphatase [Pseudogemmobacter humi]
MLQKRAGVRAGDCVVFDLDGTLADTSADLLAAANACFTAMGAACPLGAGDSLTAFHGGRAMLRLGLSRLRGGAPDEAEVDRWYPELLEHYRGAIAVHSRMYPGATDAVVALRDAGYAVSVCTNKPEALAEQLLRALGVRDLFAALVGADTLPTRKPDPAPYHLAVERAGGRVARSVLIGDTETDLLTARAVGSPVALVTFGPEGEAIARLKPDALLHRYEDLPALVGGLLA